MEQKYTPGPWLRTGTTVYALMHDGWRKGVEQFRNRFSAHVQSDRECSAEEAEANAKLIAAAPELLEALQAYQAAKAMPTHGDTSDFVWPEVTMRVPGDSTWGWICAKHGLGYQGGCICCRNDLDRYRGEQDRKARYARDDALAAADAKARAAIAKATGSAA